jgi:integrase
MSICRVEDFYKELKQYDTLKEIRACTIKELQYLNNACGTISSLKKYLSIYRSYLKDHIGDRKVSKRSLVDVLLEILKLSQEQADKYSEEYTQSVSLKNYNQRKIYDIDSYLDTAKKLLYANSYYDRIIALCVLTGRRSAEIGCTASFEPVVDEGYLLFSGQLKTKDRGVMLPYQIPVFANYYDLQQCLNSIRRDKPDLINNPTKFNKSVAKEIGGRVKKHLGDYIEGTVRIKDLRAIYATLAYENYLHSCSNDFATISHNAFFSKILGHHEKDLNTCNSYGDFCIRR